MNTGLFDWLNVTECESYFLPLHSHCHFKIYYFTICMCETQMLPSPLVSVSLIFKPNPPNTVSKIYISERKKGCVCLADPKD